MNAARVSCVALLALSGCVAPGRLSTPSGRPEVYVEGVTLEAASAACLARLMARGFQLEQCTPNVVQGVKEGGMGANILLGSTYDPTVWFRGTYLLAKDPAGVRIYLTGGIVSNRGGGFERVQFMTAQRHYDECQSALLEIRQELLAARDAAVAAAHQTATSTVPKGSAP